MWDQLLVQTELALNLLKQATLNPLISTWGYLNVPFDFTATPLEPLGSKVVIHNTVNTQNLCDQ